MPAGADARSSGSPRWKAARRDDVRSFLRGQFSRDYRATRRETAAKSQIDAAAAARVPPVRAGAAAQRRSARHLVARDRCRGARRRSRGGFRSSFRAQGVYVVEAVSAPLKAYTIVIVSDLGLVTKTAPGQMVMFAANRFTGEPAPGLRRRQSSPTARSSRPGRSTPTASFDAAAAGHASRGRRRRRAVRQAGRRDRPGQLALQQSAPRADRLRLHRQADLPARATRCTSRACCAGGSRTALAPFDRKQVEVSVTRPERQGGAPPAGGRRRVRFGARHASRCPPAPRSATTPSRVASDDDEADGQLRGPGVPQAGVRGHRQARRAVRRPGRARPSATVSARYYFGQPVAGGVVKYVVHQPAVLLAAPLGGRRDEGTGRRLVVRRRGSPPGHRAARRQGHGRRSPCPLEANEDGRDYSARIEARVTDASSREVSGNTIVHATFGRFMLVARTRPLRVSPGEPGHACPSRRVDYVGAPQAGRARDACARAADLRPRAAGTSPTVTRRRERRGDDRRRRARVLDRDAPDGTRHLPVPRRRRRPTAASSPTTPSVWVHRTWPPAKGGSRTGRSS